MNETIMVVVGEGGRIRFVEILSFAEPDDYLASKRWLGQFESKEGADKVEPETLGGVKVIFVSTEGTFSGGMPGVPPKPMENYALLGAILDHAEGPVFVKMTGPVETVRGAAKQFHAFIATAAGAKP